MSSTPLFLDFDGVPTPSGQGHRFVFLPFFERAVRQSPRPVQIIIASTWRLSRTLSELKAPFSLDVANLVTDATPYLGPGPGARHDEAMAWMESKSRSGQPWVAIDDQPGLYRPGAALVDCPRGFGTRQGQRLIEAINDPVAFAQSYPVASPTRPRAALFGA